MNQEDRKKALELIDQSSSFGILLPERPDFDTAAAAEALSSALAGDQKILGLLSPPTLHPDTHPDHSVGRADKATFPILTGPTPLLKEFVISVDTSRTPISQLRYEKPENRIDIILTPKVAPLMDNAISFHEGAIRCDALIAIGVPDVERLVNITDFPPDFFTENKLINIDIGETNAHYGEANCVDPNRASRSELVWQLLAARSPQAPLPANIRTLLLAGILSATRDLTGPTTTADTFSAVAELIRSGASHTDAQRIAGGHNPAHPLNLVQLAARASVRSKYDEQDGILWSFLTTEDFAKTGRTPDDVPAVLDSIRQTLPKSPATALLWQEARKENTDSESGSIRVILSGNQHMLDSVAQEEAGDQNDQGLILHASFSSFRDAEERVHALIRAAL